MRIFYFAFLCTIFIYGVSLVSPFVYSGDLTYFDTQDIIVSVHQPFVWDLTNHNGFGSYALAFKPLHAIFNWLDLLTSPFSFIPFAQRIYFSLLILILTLSTAFAARAFTKNSLAQMVFIALYLSNPYTVMLISGGQIGVSLAYAFLPAFFTLWYTIARSLYSDKAVPNQYYLAAVVAIPLMLMLDARVFLLSACLIIPIFVYLLLAAKRKSKILQTSAILAASMFSITCLVNAHWLLPSVFIEEVALPNGYNSTAAVEYFSFTRFAHPLTWSHPNYPDNIFGKMNEVSGLAFIFPILAFLAIKLKPSKLVIYLTSVALISAFLAKGANEPFGEIYLWFFQNIPGMSLFRDSTKFFIPLSFCYAYLISITTEKLQTTNFKKQINHKFKILNSKQIQPFVICVLLFVIYATIGVAWFPIFTNQVKGTLQYRTYPQSFQQLEQILKSDTSFGRVLWIPSREIYGYSSLNHPAVSLEDLVREPNCLKIFCLQFPQYPQDHIFSRTDLTDEIAIRMSLFNQAETENYFHKLAINYVVLSPDYDQTMYTLDYKPEPSIYAEYKSYLDNSFILKSFSDINNLAVYQVHNAGEFISNLTTGAEVTYTKINPTHYQIQWSGGQAYLLVSQSHDQRWQIRDAQNNILAVSQATAEGLSSFDMNFPAGTYSLVFSGQEFADIGWIISRIAMCIGVLLLIALWLSSRKKFSP